MAYVRDRLNELQVQHEDEKEKHKAKKPKSDKELKLFLKECDAVRESFTKINENTGNINEFLRKNRYYTFEELKDGVNPLSKDSERIIIKINQKLQEIKIDPEDVERVPNANNKMKFMQFTSLREGFKTTLDSYTDAMKAYEGTLENMRRGIQRTVQGENYDDTQELLEEVQEQMYTGNYFAEKREAELQLRDVEERHDQLLKIEGQLTEVRDLFVKIAILVEQQQESVNRAEFHAAMSSRAIETANQDLIKAKKKKKNVTKIKIILVVVAIVVGTLIVVSCFV